MKTQASLALLILICMSNLCAGQTAIEHCKTYQEGRPDLCQECEPYFGLSSNSTQCLKCRPNCPGCVQLGDGSMTCTTCAPNYFKFSFDFSKELTVCQPCDKNCAECQDYIGCNRCKDTYFKLRGDYYPICKPCDPNCVECIENIGCSQCSHGFYKKNLTMATVVDCVSCDLNCGECKDDIGCNRCNKDFYRYQSSRPNVGFKCRNCDKNCDKCEDLVGCSKCQEKFFAQLVDFYSEEKKCTMCDPNCTNCVDDKGCSECKPRFYPKYNSTQMADTCSACTDGCLTCSSTWSCSSCEEGYRTSGSYCYACTVPNCKSCPTYSSTCTACKDGFTLVSAFGINQKCSGSDGLSYAKIMIILVVLFFCCVASIMITRCIQKDRSPGADANQRTEETITLNAEDNLTNPLK